MAQVVIATKRFGTQIAMCGICRRNLGIHRVGNVDDIRIEDAHFDLLHPGRKSVTYGDHVFWHEVQVVIKPV